MTTANVLGKRPRIDALTILVGLYDVFGLVCMFSWDPRRPAHVSSHYVTIGKSLVSS